MLNRFQLNTISTNSLISTLFKQIVSISRISHGTKLGKILNDIDDKNQMWNKEVIITSISASKVFGVKIT